MLWLTKYASHVSHLKWPGPIIAYPYKWMTHWLKNLLKLKWHFIKRWCISWKICKMQLFKYAQHGSPVKGIKWELFKICKTKPNQTYQTEPSKQTIGFVRFWTHVSYVISLLYEGYLWENFESILNLIRYDANLLWGGCIPGSKTHNCGCGYLWRKCWVWTRQW